MFSRNLLVPVLLTQVLLGIAAPTSRRSGGVSVSLTKSSSFAQRNGTFDLDALRAYSATAAAKYSGRLYLDYSRRQTGSAPLDDVGDDAWLVPVQIGSTGLQLMLQVDTGSTDVILAPGTYNPSDSWSSVNTGQSFEDGYGQGDTYGQVYLDTVTVAGLTASAQAIGLTTNDTSNGGGSFFNNDAQGILGLAYPQLSQLRESQPFFYSLVAQGVVPDAVFAVNLAEADPSIYFGASDAPFVGGDYTWSPVTAKGWWQITMDSVNVNGQSPVGQSNVIIDTGTTIIYGPTDAVAAFYAAIPGADVSEGYYVVPCASPPSGLSITFSGVSWPMSLDDFISESDGICYGGIQPLASDALPNGMWVIGDVFLINQATAFDTVNNRVGFASLA